MPTEVNADQPRLQSFQIDDDLDLAGDIGIEVTVSLSDGSKRWCFFMTPSALSTAGDWVEGTEVRHHLGELHMIVVSELSADIIDRVLMALDRNNDLLRRTLPL